MDDRYLLTAEEGQSLVRVARGALEARLRSPWVETEGASEAEAPVLGARLEERGATFVTLTIDGQLRGCIGTAEAHCSLQEDVEENAVRAATMDPRFPPLSMAELDRTHLEVSVLTPPRPLACAPEERPEQVKGLGLLLMGGHNRSLLLPQVWDKIPDPHEFLEVLCRKAGLPRDAWRRPEVDLYVFHVQAFDEEH